jgi:hypothetical protein
MEARRRGRPPGGCYICGKESVVTGEYRIRKKVPGQKHGPIISSISRSMCEEHAHHVFKFMERLPSLQRPK